MRSFSASSSKVRIHPPSRLSEARQSERSAFSISRGLARIARTHRMRRSECKCRSIAAVNPGTPAIDSRKSCEMA